MTSWPHLYLHVPFCGRRCSYCDFAIAVRREVPVSEFIDAIMAEFVTRRISLNAGLLRTIYFGGGTPSKLGGEGVARLLHGIRELAGVGKFSTSVDALEITIEANPEDVSAESAAAWVAAGVNRVSLGVQSFEPAVLQWMHREHPPTRAAEAVRELRAAGVQEISADLIFSVPEALGRSWTTDLERVLELDVEHLSLYGLTVEPKTPLGRWTARGEVQEAPEERYEAEFLEAHERLGEAGYEHYEVSNYARPGKRARHNSAYWTGASYLGIGPSAHGFDGRERRWNLPAYAEWLREVRAGRDPVGGREVLGGQKLGGGKELAGGHDPTLGKEPVRTAGSSRPPQTGLEPAERIYLGLRTIDGLAIRENELKKVTSWIGEGWATLDGDRLRLTPRGWLRLDALAAALLDA
ncbi:MAG: radical SAM family heme chaperone HemW [Gemmatimonadaceae bacterium]|nr:radical SAM family heme chaperone HemW [Gemmatimonadaceae bacterium]